MRNRAKCKKCGSIIESFHPTDFVICACDEIALDGGDALRCYARDWQNFLRIDDEGNEIVPKIEDVITAKNPDAKMPPHTSLAEDISPKKDDALEALKLMIDSYFKLPSSALNSPATNADLCNVMMILYQGLKERE